MNLLVMIFKTDQSDFFYYKLRWVATVSGFQLVQEVTLDVPYWPAAICNASMHFT